jgi:hypothetical protein
MKGFDPSTSFGDAASRDYDAVSVRGDEDETVAFLAGLAGDRDLHRRQLAPRQRLPASRALNAATLIL